MANARIVTVRLERSDTGLTFATSSDMPDLFLTKRSRAEIEAVLPGVIRELRGLDGEHCFAFPLEAPAGAETIALAVVPAGEVEAIYAKA